MKHLMPLRAAESEVRYFDASELRFTEATGDQPPRLSGYAAKFNTLSHPIATPRGSFREQLKPGAFAPALASGDNTVFRTEHRDLPLADTATNTLRLSQDDIGLRFEADLDESDPDVQRLLPKVRRGTMRSMSFAFRIAKGGDAWERVDGQLQRNVNTIDRLVDVSPVSFPAYPETTLALRSLVAFEALEPPTDATRAAGALAAAMTTEMAAACRAFVDIAWSSSWSMYSCGDTCAYCYAMARAASQVCQSSGSVVSDCAIGDAKVVDAVSALRSAIAVCAIARATFAACPDGYTACATASEACVLAEKSATDCIAALQPADPASTANDGDNDAGADAPARSAAHETEKRRVRMRLQRAAL